MEDDHDALRAFSGQEGVGGFCPSDGAANIESYAYFRTVFTELPNATSVAEIEAKLPVPADDDSIAALS